MSDNPQSIEVLLHIDEGDIVMEALVASEQKKRKFVLKVFRSDLVKGYSTLWKPLNLLWKETNSQAYFILNISDEMLFQTKGWDTIVKQYIGYYPDHVFRLRASKYRYRNYTDFWENGYAPDSLAFYTRKWLELSGDWNPCLGPDSFQQCIAYYLFTSEPFSRTQFNRDIPVPNLEFSGEGAGIGLEGKAKYKRIIINNRAWFILMSHRMQQEANHRAMRMKSYIIAQNYNSAGGAIVRECSRHFEIISSATNETLHKISSGLSWPRITLTNLWRMREVHYYAGGGVHAKRYPFAGYFVMVVTYIPYGDELFFRAALLRERYGRWRKRHPQLSNRIKAKIKFLAKRLLVLSYRIVKKLLSTICRLFSTILLPRSTVNSLRSAKRQLSAIIKPPIVRMVTHLRNKNSQPIHSEGVELVTHTPQDPKTHGNARRIDFSIQLSSNRPANVVEFLDNIERTATHPERIEVLVHIDTGDTVMENTLRQEQGNRKIAIRYVDSNLVKDVTHLWKAYNLLFQSTDPEAYFVTLLSDEVRFETTGWDRTLMSYEGYYPDNIFRVRCSKYRFRNYTDFWENGFAPDSLAFYTRKWLAIQGDWNPCTGPDSFQQCVAFYLFTSNPFSHIQHHRDIVENFLVFSGEKGGVELDDNTGRKGAREKNREWFTLMSHSMQEDAKKRAMLLKANIIKGENVMQCPQDQYVVSENKVKRIISLETKDGALKIELSYKLSHFSIRIVNSLRAIFIQYYAGGGKAWRKPIHGEGGATHSLLKAAK